MWSTCGVLSEYVLSMYHANFPYISMEILLKLTRAPDTLKSAIETIWTSAKILLFLLLWASCPVFWKWPYAELQAVKDNNVRRIFQVFLQQTRKNSHFLLWLSNQKHGIDTEVALICLFLWHLNVNSVIFGSISHQAHSAHIQLPTISTNMFGNTIPPLVW